MSHRIEIVEASAQELPLGVLEYARHSTSTVAVLDYITIGSPYAGGRDVEDFVMAEAERLDLRQKHRLAVDFAARARDEVPGIEDIRLSSDDDELLVSVFTADRDMDRDLGLQRLFLECARPYGRSDWSLRVLTLDERDEDDMADAVLP
jgi:hypothetical protein